MGRPWPPQPPPRCDGRPGRGHRPAATALRAGPAGHRAAGSGGPYGPLLPGLEAKSAGDRHQRQRAGDAQSRACRHRRPSAPNPRQVAPLHAGVPHRAGAGRHLRPAADAPSRPRFHQRQRRAAAPPHLERLRRRGGPSTVGADPSGQRGVTFAEVRTTSMGSTSARWYAGVCSTVRSCAPTWPTTTVHSLTTPPVTGPGNRSRARAPRARSPRSPTRGWPSASACAGRYEERTAWLQCVLRCWTAGCTSRCRRNLQRDGPSFSTPHALLGSRTVSALAIRSAQWLRIAFENKGIRPPWTPTRTG